MAVFSQQVTVGTTPTRLDTTSMYKGSVRIRNRGLASVFLGGASVTAATGYELGAGDALTFDGNTNGDPLWAIAATVGQKVHILQVGG